MTWDKLNNDTYAAAHRGSLLQIRRVRWDGRMVWLAIAKHLGGAPLNYGFYPCREAAKAKLEEVVG